MSPSSDDPSVAAARRLYDEGSARYETLDYPGAIDLWTRAYGQLGEPQHDSIRIMLLDAIAMAHENAFGVDADPAHLRQARGLLERHRSGYVRLYGAESEGAKEHLLNVDGRLGDIAVELATSPGPVAAPTTVPSPKVIEDPRLLLKYRTVEILKTPGTLRNRHRGGGAMVTSGIIATVVGGVATVVGAGVLNDDYANGSDRDWAIASLAVGIPSLVVGVVLLSTGMSMRHSARRRARAQAQLDLGLAPSQ